MTATDSVTVSGAIGQTNGFANLNEDDMRQRIQDAMANAQRQGVAPGDMAQAVAGRWADLGLGAVGFGGGPGGGGFGGGGGRGGGGGGRGGGGGGGFRNFNANQFHGAVAYTGANSALNANSYSVTGIPIPKPASDRNTLIASVTGSPYIPGLTKPNPKQFMFLSVQATRNTIPSLQQVIVPTAAQRVGDLSGSGPVYDPTTGNPFGATNCSPALLAINPNPTACIPQNELNASGVALLNYYPLPNVTSTGTLDNYQTNTTASTHSDQISARYNRSFGAAPARGGRGGGFGGGGGRGQGQQNRNAPAVLRQSIAENFAYSHSASSSQSFSPELGGNSETNGYSLTSSYTVGYGRLNSTATLGWNRSLGTGNNYFTNAAINPAQTAGVNVGTPTIYNNPFYFGVPSVALTGFKD